MSSTIRHLAISASAGAGKTFQLAHRYIGLLAVGALPETIIALTFSRKAAGEMFARILQTLAAAASDQEEARKLDQQLHDCDFLPAGRRLERKQIIQLLRQMVNASHRLRIGTLDGFLVSIIQAFPFEFGLGGNLTILDGYPAKAARQEALHRVFLQLRGGDSEAGRHFLDNFRLTTYGQESKGFSATLQSYIENYHHILMEAGNADLWGNHDLVWPEGNSWLSMPDYPEKAVATLQDFLRQEELSSADEKKWEDFFSVLPDFHPAAHWAQVKTIYPKLRDLEKPAPDAPAELKIGRKTIVLPPAVYQAARKILVYITAAMIDARLRRTRGLFQILNQYENVYRRNIRQTGQLTFSDIAFLLGRRHLSEPGESPEMSDFPGGNIGRMHLDYRLDSHFDHWLLDEFQDTSTLQWQAIANLVDEVVQDSEGRRSFFYVGDVKQAIYDWRGGDPALFEWVRQKYRHAIAQQPLTRSYRSSQPVIDLVNNVFDNLDCSEPPLDPRIYDRWRHNWGHHTTARTELPGFAAVYSFPYEKKELRLESEEDRFMAVLQVLQQVKPWERGLSAAALVRTNDHGRRLTGFLQDAGVPAYFAGKFGILDTPVNSALVELIKIAEHPGDLYAWQHLRMTPLQEHLPDTQVPASKLITSLLRTLANEGFAELLKEWSEKVTASLTDFETARTRQLIIAARQFDAMGGGRVFDFLEYLQEYQVEDLSSSGTVQVMTNHKAKGLQFDLVLLPCLDRHQGIDAVGGGNSLHIARDNTVERRPRWVLDMPVKDVTLADPVLTAAYEQMRIDNACEELCNLYVAMTRAKYAVYIFRSEPGAGSRTIRPTTLIADALTENAGDQTEEIEINGKTVRLLYRNGDPNWFQVLEEKTVEESEKHRPAPLTAEQLKKSGQRQRYRRETPSEDEEHRSDQAAWLFNMKNQKYAQFGTALHAFISRIEWYYPNLDLDRIFESAMQELDIDHDIGGMAMGQLRKALSQPAIQQALSKPDSREQLEVWLERRFELIINQIWISGCFDRVVVSRNQQGQATAAVITDFKTSVIKTQAELEQARCTYRPQLKTYRQALGKILNLDRQQIKTQLIFTRSGDVLSCH